MPNALFVGGRNNPHQFGFVQTPANGYPDDEGLPNGGVAALRRVLCDPEGSDAIWTNTGW